MISTIRNVLLIEISNLKKLGSSNMESTHYKILVVDDEEKMRKLIASQLQAMEKIWEVPNGKNNRF
jgi:PleD family two-component response regulator